MKYLFSELVLGDEGLLKGPFGSDLKKSLYVPKGKDTYKVYLQENILKESNTAGTHYISKQYFESSMYRYQVHENDFIVTCDGTLGEIFQIKGVFEDGIISSSLLRISLNPDLIDYDYFYYYFKLVLKKVLIRQGNNSVLKHLPGIEVIRNISIDLPSIGTQKAISSILKTIDDKKKNNELIISELEAMAKDIYDYWFVQFDFPDENGKPYKSSGGKMVWNEELKREIPEGWKVSRLDSIESVIVTGKTPSTSCPENFDGPIPFVTIGDIRGHRFIVATEKHLSLTAADSQRNKYIPAGAICVTCIASPGLVGITTEKCQSNQQINSVVCSEINREYLTYFIEDYFRFSSGAKTGNTFENMNKEDFSSILIPYHQNEIEQFHGKINTIFNLMRTLYQENAELASLRDFLLPLLMNDQVKVGNMGG